MEGAHLLYKGEVRGYLLHHITADRGYVQGIPYGAVYKIIGNLFRHVNCNILLGLVSGSAQVRGAYYLFQRQQRVVCCRWFLFKYVKGSSSDLACLYSFSQIGLVYDPASCAVYDHYPVLHLCEGVLIKQVLCLLCHWYMEGDKVRPFVKLIKGNQFHAKLNGLVRRYERVIRYYVHLQPLGSAYNNGADVSDTDYAKGLVRYLLTHILVLFPLGGLC